MLKSFLTFKLKVVRSLVAVPGRASVNKVKEVTGGGIFVQKQLSKIGTPSYEHERMRAEIELMQQLTNLSCPYIVKYVDDDEDENSISLYMEYFEYSLNDLIKRKKANGKPFSDIRICDYVLQIAEGYFIFYSYCFTLIFNILD